MSFQPHKIPFHNLPPIKTAIVTMPDLVRVSAFLGITVLEAIIEHTRFQLTYKFYTSHVYLFIYFIYLFIYLFLQTVVQLKSDIRQNIKIRLWYEQGDCLERDAPNYSSIKQWNTIHPKLSWIVYYKLANYGIQLNLNIQVQRPALVL